MDYKNKKIGSYETLWVYQKSECVYDITYYFVSHFLDRVHDRTADQMQQAARSGKQNIVEGYSDAEGSSGSHHKLTVIAKGSLEELKEDYRDYLRNHELELWGPQHPKYLASVPLFKKHNDSAYYRRQIEGRSDEDIANIALIVIHQTLALLRNLIDDIDRRFLSEGGIKEQRYRARLEYREGGRYGRCGRYGTSSAPSTTSTPPTTSTPSTTSTTSTTSTPPTPSTTSTPSTK